MRCEVTTFYESSNGDKWLIARDPATDHVFVQHRANLPSGGHVTDVEVSRFLRADAAGPEHQALRRLIEELRQPTTDSTWPLFNDQGCRVDKRNGA